MPCGGGTGKEHHTRSDCDGDLLTMMNVEAAEVSMEALGARLTIFITIVVVEEAQVFLMGSYSWCS